ERPDTDRSLDQARAAGAPRRLRRTDARRTSHGIRAPRNALRFRGRWISRTDLRHRPRYDRTSEFSAAALTRHRAAPGSAPTAPLAGNRHDVSLKTPELRSQCFGEIVAGGPAHAQAHLRAPQGAE